MPIFATSTHSAGRNVTVLFALSTLLLPSAIAAQNMEPGESTASPSARVMWESMGYPVGQAQEPEIPVLVLTGTAQVEAEPDRARVVFAVETEGSTAREAGEANADLMTEVSAAIRAAVGTTAGFRLETSGYSLTPLYGPYRDGRNAEIIGYIARNSIQVRMDVVDQSGTLIDAALGAGANRVAGIGFDLRNPEPVRHEAVRQAIAQARSEAEVMAAALGMRLGPPIEVQGGADFYYPPQPYMAARGEAMMMDQAAAAPTPVESGMQTVTARVTIRFRLDPLP
jgi:uncharacterized protein YggE